MSFMPRSIPSTKKLIGLFIGLACLASLIGQPLYRWLRSNSAGNTQNVSAQSAQAQLQESYGKLPMSFEANQGQTDKRVKFLSRGSGYSLFLTSTEAVLSLSKPSSVETRADASGGAHVALEC